MELYEQRVTHIWARMLERDHRVVCTVALLAEPPAPGLSTAVQLYLTTKP